MLLLSLPVFLIIIQSIILFFALLNMMVAIFIHIGAFLPILILVLPLRMIKLLLLKHLKIILVFYEESKDVVSSDIKIKFSDTSKISGSSTFQKIRITGENLGDGIILYHNSNFDNSLPTIIHFHGNAVFSKHHPSEFIGIANEYNCNIVSVEYPGYEKNKKIDYIKSFPSSKKLLKHAEIAVSYIRTYMQVQDSDITLCGHSLGSVIATKMAVKFKQINKLLLVSPIISTDNLYYHQFLIY